MQDTASTHLIVLQIMEQLLNKAGDVFVNQFMRLGTSAKLLEIAGPLDKSSDSLLTASSAKETAQDEADSGVMKETGAEPEASKEPDPGSATKEAESESRSAIKESELESESRSATKEQESESRSATKEPDSKSRSGTKEPEVESESRSATKELESKSGSKESLDSVEPELESSSKPPDPGSEHEPESSFKDPVESDEQPDPGASGGILNLTLSKESDLEPLLKPELVSTSEQDSGSNILEPSQQLKLGSNAKPDEESAMEIEMEHSESSKKPDLEPNKELVAALSEEPVRFILVANQYVPFLYSTEQLQPRPL